MLLLQIYRHNILINKNDIDWSYRYITTIIEEVSGSSGTNLQALRTFRVFRALKTISIIPGEFTLSSDKVYHVVCLIHNNAG